MNTDTILVWQDEEATIFSNNAFFKSPTKPKLSFDFDVLICESPTNVFFRVLDKNQFLLTELQIEECKKYCDNFYNLGDYHVYAYNPNDLNIYKGYILKSECEKHGYKWIVDKRPESNAASYNEKTNEWTIYYASITENGWVSTNITQIGQSVVKLLTKEEYDKLPPKPHSTDSWDFVSESWIDKRDLALLKKEAILNLREHFEGVRWKAMNEYVPQYEQDMWRVQLEEAKNWLTNKNASTPYIDTFLANRTDNKVPSKKELVEDIIKNNNSYIQEIAKVNAKQWSYMKEIQNASDGYSIDDIQNRFIEYIHTII